MICVNNDVTELKKKKMSESEINIRIKLILLCVWILNCILKLEIIHKAFERAFLNIFIRHLLCFIYQNEFLVLVVGIVNKHLSPQVIRYWSGTGETYKEPHLKKFTISFQNLSQSLRWNWWCPDPSGKASERPRSVRLYHQYLMQMFICDVNQCFLHFSNCVFVQ